VKNRGAQLNVMLSLPLIIQAGQTDLIASACT
jgi:hypothetical protein